MCRNTAMTERAFDHVCHHPPAPGARQEWSGMASKFPNGDVLNLRVLSFSPVPPHPSWAAAHWPRTGPRKASRPETMFPITN